MDIKKQNCVDAFVKLGLPDADSYFGAFSQQGIFARLEEGTIDVGNFHHKLHEVLPAGVTDEQIDEAFCKFLIGIPEHRLAELRRLRHHYKVYMLSNTNPIMWTRTIAAEFRKEGLERDDYFDGIVTSFTAKALKPDERIFKYAESRLGIKPEETIFIDDSQRNLDAAAALGFGTMLVGEGEEFYDKLQQKL